MTQTTLREYLRTIEDAISSNRFDEAMANCQNILTYFPEALEAQRLLGEVYLGQQKLDEAQHTFEWILTNDPENVIVYCDRALISERTGDVDTALDCYQQAYELSRGNIKIREAFNHLSVQAGQQEFMFSRAGLARLYMRGDLLTQAVQEWETILAISPERLDARLGLLETHWREGSYDKAEQIASLILEEIPTCLKALLYLAHIASISHIQRAKDLLRRAEELDPELALAQELFADLAASSPADPFLTLIKKEPIVLENGMPLSMRQPAAVEQPVQAEPAAAFASTYAWDLPDERPVPASVLARASQPLPAPQANMVWESGAGAYPPVNEPEQEIPSWQTQMEAYAPIRENEPEWPQADPFGQPKIDVLPAWNVLDAQTREDELPAHPVWLDTLTRSEPASSPSLPAIPVPMPPPMEAPPLVREAPLAPPMDTFAVQEQQSVNEEEMPFFFPADDESEEGPSWPDWLKSLGAESLEPEAKAASELAVSEPPAVWDVPTTAVPPQSAPSLITEDPWASLPAMSISNDSWSNQNGPSDWMQQISPREGSLQDAIPDWMQQIAPREVTPMQAAKEPTPDWMQQVAPREAVPMQPMQETTPDWMQNLAGVESNPVQSVVPDWMQQFTNTQTQDTYQNPSPDWMHQFADNAPRQEPAEAVAPAASEQEERYLASLSDLERSLQAQGFVPLAPGALASLAQNQVDEPAQTPEDHMLSSALAQLGNFASPVTNAGNTVDTPWWNSVTPPAMSEPGVPQTVGEALNPFTALGARNGEPAAPVFTSLPATPVPQGQSFAPFSNTNGTAAPAPRLNPAYRSDALLDSDLETTMKRPAIKLQPMKNAETSERHAPGVKNQSERKPVDHTADANLNNHERLVRGYQYQLAGAYEDAMQEYRLIIRNAPELLDDVISNIRALLKFNPRFSLAYRVLGDAYMRKGEYLQAMEAYNKALTMAKKAKS